MVMTKWFSLPRLETRTKESNVHASTGVTSPRAKMKVTVVGPYVHNLPATILREKGLSASMNVRTRKMVNYS